MSVVKNGDTVKVHYHGTLDDGTVFDSSHERDPLNFTLGQGEIIPGFENAVQGMSQGDSKNVSIPPDEAYGQRQEDNMLQVNQSDIPEEINPEKGMVLQVKTQDGQSRNVTVAEVTDETVTLDGNHPLAGENLNFEINLVEVQPASA
ncbi:MAG: peptidylprolyl isomerase [Desulfohalobiaceae bacterium]|nr:peptidylprolyl isomerase [Desulfohalobiaceae bacterium]